MLAELKIQNFKGISSFNVKDLGLVNLFIGKNDSGKSTIMEAAYCLFGELKGFPQLQRLMTRRSNVSVGGSELWFKYDTNSQIEITAVFDEVRLDWRIALAANTIDSRLFAGKTQLVLIGRTQYSGSDFSLTMSGSQTMIDNIRESEEFKRKLANFAMNVALIDCTLKSQTREIERVLARFKRESSLESKFGAILDDIYGKGKEWEFIPQLEDTEQRRLAIREAGQPKYFSGFGDGLRCCVGILGKAMSVKNTALFAEEIESHQHSGSLSKMVRHLVQIARENNLQIFLSTHSMDVWESLSRGVYVDDEEREKQEFRCFLVERNIDTGEVTAEYTDNVQKITAALK
jgi:AAA15 family ATPase/GTPase